MNKNTINPNTKVADLLKQHPQTYPVFQKYGCPDMRKGFFSLMARIMSIRSAASIHSIPLDMLLADLNVSVKNDESASRDTRNRPLP